MRSPARTIKASVLGILLLVESYYLTASLLIYVANKDYFTPSTETIVQILACILALMYTHALTVGIWNKWEQYVVVPVPVSLGILGSLVTLDPLYALALALTSGLILVYYVSKANSIRLLLIKFVPGLIFRPTTRALIFIAGITAASLVLINPISGREINIGEEVGDIAAQQIENFLNKDFTVATILRSGLMDFNIRREITRQVNMIVEPYENFLTPIAAVVVFLLVQGTAAVVYIIYGITIRPLFWFAKKIRFLNVAYVQVNQEVLRFMPYSTPQVRPHSQPQSPQPVSEQV